MMGEYHPSAESIRRSGRHVAFGPYTLQAAIAAVLLAGPPDMR